nr:simiate [Limnoporus dissortis]
MQDSATQNVCSIENSIDLNEEYQSVVDRYYMRKFCVDVCEPKDDYSVLIHSNGVCLISLAPSHSIIKTDKRVKSVSFQVARDLNRDTGNRVSGKLKHGAQKVKPTSPLLVATFEDGSTKTARCPINGKLLEVNQRLLTTPDLMITSPDDIGYIAIILPDQSIQNVYRESLLSLAQYQDQISNQKSSLLDTYTNSGSLT